jgi:hypothetical protein
MIIVLILILLLSSSAAAGFYAYTLNNKGELRSFLGLSELEDDEEDDVEDDEEDDVEDDEGVEVDYEVDSEVDYEVDSEVDEVPEPVETISPFEGYTKHANNDIGGNDIACFNDGSSAEFCKAKCDGDSDCTGYNYIKPDGPWKGNGAGHGCCYKRGGGSLKQIQNIDFYKKN